MPNATEEWPYQPSAIIGGISWDFKGLKRAGHGSDLWPVTWADDGYLYTSWGDGGGFGGSNFKGRVSLGFALIKAAPAHFTGQNIWGGYQAETPSTFRGKCSGMLCVGGILYAWINTPQEPNVQMRLAWSLDHGRTWNLSQWRFGASDTFRDITFLNFGRDYKDARDDFVYSYALERGGTSDPPNLLFTQISLFRVAKKHSALINRGSYEFFVGLDISGYPIWARNINKRKPVFVDHNGVGIPSVSFDSGINRYLMTTAHGPFGDGLRRLGIFEALEPWGPWATVQYNSNWGGYPGFWLGYYIPTKTPDWMSLDGKTIHLIFSGQGELDSFNVIRGTLRLRTQ